MTVLPLELRNRFMLGDVRAQLELLPAESVHCVVTSPPYWSMRDYGAAGQLGLEDTLEEYIEAQVEVFRAVWRVLRRDGVVWLNVGDAYIGGRRGGIGASSTLEGSAIAQNESRKALDARQSFRRDRIDAGDVHHKASPGLKPKDLAGIPWTLALALRADGWWLRSDVIWRKPNAAPESIIDRPTKEHEYVFLLTKAARYFYDREAIREPFKDSTKARIRQKTFALQTGGPKDYRFGVNPARSSRRTLENVARQVVQKRNKRSVWTIPTEASKRKHYATFPRALVRQCLLAGTSEVGACMACGAPWVRCVAVEDPAGALGKGYHDHTDDLKRGQRGIPYAKSAPTRRTTGWRPSCEHEAPAGRCVVLDPYMGSGTTAVVANELGHDFVGIDINAEYIAIAERRLENRRGL